MDLPKSNSFLCIEYFFKNKLKETHSLSEINSIFYLLIEDLFGISKVQFVLEKNYGKFSESDINKINESLSLLIKEVPIQYVLGQTHFFDLPIKVNPNVLIPRPETEELVDWIIQTCSSNFSGSILDIGTGSGAIALALKKNLLSSKIYGLDVSAEAIEIAQQNSKDLNLEVTFINHNILNYSSLLLDFQPNIIVSNPPYVLRREEKEMAPHVKNQEPHLALFVDDNDPLLFYRQIAKFALKKLSKNGLLFFETNESFGEETLNLLDSIGFIYLEIKKDLNGKDRMVKATANN